MENKLFYTLLPNGKQVLRDLANEGVRFTREGYLEGKFDAYNYQWHEMFNHYVYDDNGCDYERYGCTIQPGDVVLDIGANIGIFAHRAEVRGASKVISFEPITLTFDCLTKNKGPKTLVYKNAVGDKNGFAVFHTDHTFMGGIVIDDSKELLPDKDIIIHSEEVIIIGINEIFDGFNKKIDFMKIDIEGNEVSVLSAISDENLQSLRCLSAEFHRINEEFDNFQDRFIGRMTNLGFAYFAVYHGDGNLRTLTFWKK